MNRCGKGDGRREGDGDGCGDGDGNEVHVCSGGGGDGDGRSLTGAETWMAGVRCVVLTTGCVFLALHFYGSALAPA